MSGGGIWGEALARLPSYLGQHVLLSVSAILLGLGISLPLALASARSRRLRGPLLSFASVVQTVPGLALLALFYPLLLALSAFTRSAFGISFGALGFLPALLALTLYSMLPVLRNTIAGLDGIDPAIRMAARGVGMTGWQSMWMVELPLAAPVIIAGIRTAAVWVIGTATLSTPVGQTSLGNYIFTGLQTENWVFVLFGCVAAAALALTIDRLLALIHDGIAMRSKLRLGAAAAGLIAVVGLGIWPGIAPAAGAVTIGTKSFGEQYILGALIQDRLERAGIASTRRDGLGSNVLFHALSGGEVDVCVDYSGTIWTNEMHRADLPGRQAVLTQMSQWLARTRGIRMLGPLGFENAYALAMRADRAQALHIRSLADLAAYAPRMKIGGDFEIFSRPEWRSVVQAYGLKFAEQRQYQANFMYRAAASGTVDVITAFSSDGQIARYDLVLLTDPRGALPPYDAVILVSHRSAGNARLIAALQPLIGSIDLTTMQRANLMVDRDTDKRSPAEVARMLSGRIGRR
ncbi:MAG TPA: ABC transporter permease/substrate-binding protein [Rhizomicrobium sp.]|nr:ABC transporter permease/substrate-binding protein [Rhizomicrobium sp.]